MDFSLGKRLSVAVERRRVIPAFFHDTAFEKDCSTYKYEQKRESCEQQVVIKFETVCDQDNA